MLPATGLFRSINCPFFEKDLCPRPFCHFRHLKPEAPVKATYSATPKSLLNQSNASEAPPALQDVPVKKKPKLEYIPMPTILTAKYVPSTRASTVPSNNNDKDNEPQIQLKQDVKSITEHKTESSTDVEQAREVPEIELTNGQNGNEPNHDDHDKSVSPTVTKDDNATETPIPDAELEIKVEKRKDSEKSKSTPSAHHKSSHESDRKARKDDKNHRHDAKSHRKDSERKASSSTSERKHSSSSSSHREEKHRSRSDREKDRDKDRTKSKHKDSSRDKEKQLVKEKERTRSSDKDRDKERKKSSDKERSKSSHSSSKSSSKSSSSSRKPSSSSSKERPPETVSASSSSSSKPKVELADEIYRDLLDNPPSDIDIDSDEDEVMRQCRMIFEEYEDEPPPAPTVPAVPKAVKRKPDSKNSGSDVELIDMFAEKFYDENRKKRVAHESTSNAKPSSSAQSAPAKRTNHVQEAMRSVYHRQEIVRKQQEELAAKQKFEENNKKRIDDDTRKAMSKPVTPRLSNGSPRSPVLSPTSVTTPPTTEKSPISPISTSSFYSKSPDTVVTTTPRSRFTPAVNVLAFQKAKEKIEQLRKMKGIGTPAQTAPKGSGRIAHTVPAVTAPPVASTSSTTSTAAPPSQPAPPTKAAPPLLEAESTKISYNVRMQYYNLMIKHCLNIYSDCEDAYDRAQTEELAVMKKCKTPMIYKSSALLTINKLRKEAVDSGSETTERNKTISHDVILAGKMGHNISWSVNKKLKTEVKSAYTIDNAPSTVAYKMIYECILTDEQLKTNGFPRPTDIPGKAKIHTTKPSRPPNEEERYCSRCSKVFNLTTYEEPAVDSCNYHAKSTCYRRGFADNLHSCCQQPSGTAGCMYANYHVSSYVDYDDLTGFVKTIEPPEGYVPSKKDIFALDCEMCYTTGGLELTRVTVVDINEKTVYDALVKPTNKVIDYNTRFSGITEQLLKNTTTTLHNVQAVLLSMFNSETILIGHSLESDFKALKLIHDVVVDTSVLYPHKMGPPKKRALKTLCIENLKKIIQENDSGHDSAEDSVVCIQLIKHYLRNRII